MEAQLLWKDGLAFKGTTHSGFEMVLDSSVEHGGNNEGPRPMELILLALGGCTSMDVISILSKKRQNVKKFEIFMHADRAVEHPRVFTDITIEYVVTGTGIDPEAVQRAIELSENKYCPGMAMLRKAANITTSFRVVEE